VFVPQAVEFNLDRDGAAASEPYTKGRSAAGKEKDVAKFPSVTSQETQATAGTNPQSNRSESSSRSSSSSSAEKEDAMLAQRRSAKKGTTGSVASSNTQRSMRASRSEGAMNMAQLLVKESAQAEHGSGEGSARAPPDSPSSPNASSGLAARRNFIMQGKALNVITGPMEEEEEALSSKKKSIRWVDNFGEFYDLGKQVMPSFHKGMQILHATRRSDNLEVVVKVRLKNDAAGRKNRKGSWLGGAEFMLNLPPRVHIARIFDVVEDRDAYYVVMEKVSGKDLFETISGKVLLPTDEVKDIIFQILAALADLHAQGQIHRDLKLENVMIDRTLPIPESSRKVSYFPSRGSPKAPHSPMWATSATPVSVKLIDFDTLEQYEAKAPKAARDVLGTNQYIAQEAYDGQYSPASDIFAAGVIGYRLLTGRYPFKSEIFDDKPGENWVGSPKMLEIRSKVCDFQIKWTYAAFESQPEAGNLLQRMLAQAARDRPSAKEALQHPWLARASSVLASPKSSAGGSGKGGSSKKAAARRFSDFTPGGRGVFMSPLSAKRMYT